MFEWVVVVMDIKITHETGVFLWLSYNDPTDSFFAVYENYLLDIQRKKRSNYPVTCSLEKRVDRLSYQTLMHIRFLPNFLSDFRHSVIFKIVIKISSTCVIF